MISASSIIFSSPFLDIPCGGSASKFSRSSRGLRTNDGNCRCGKDEKVGTDTRCRAVVRAPSTARKCRAVRLDGRRAIAGAKMRVGKFVHFSGNASPRCGGKVTRDRQDTCGAWQAALPSVRSRVSSVPHVPSRNADNPIHTTPSPNYPAAFILRSLYYFRNFPPRSPPESC